MNRMYEFKSRWTDYLDEPTLPLLLDLLISYLVQYIDSNIQYSLLGASHRARIQAIFAADFDIDGCSAEQMDRTYRMETSRGWIFDRE